MNSKRVTPEIVNITIKRTVVMINHNNTARLKFVFPGWVDLLNDQTSNITRFTTGMNRIKMVISQSAVDKTGI